MAAANDEGSACGELMDSLKFFMPMEHVPTSTAQEKGYKVVTQKMRTGAVKHKVIVFEKPQAEQAKRILMESLNLVRVGMHRDVLVCKEHPLYPKDVPLSLSVKWCFENYRIGNDGRKTVTHSHGSYRVTKPDTDNLNKALKDCMTELGFWADDAQVVEEQIGKYWSQVPGVFVEIRVLKQ